MKIAHSLGFAHYELMLAAMTNRQYMELLEYLESEYSRKEQAKLNMDDKNILRFLNRAERLQRRKAK